MTWERAVAAAFYLLASCFWTFAMAGLSVWSCIDGCTGGEHHRLNVSFVLSLVALAVAAAAIFASLLTRWVGLLLLAAHIVVFSINFALFLGTFDFQNTWIIPPLAAVAVAAGYVAVGGIRSGVTKPGEGERDPLENPP